MNRSIFQRATPLLLLLAWLSASVLIAAEAKTATPAKQEPAQEAGNDDAKETPDGKTETPEGETAPKIESPCLQEDGTLDLPAVVKHFEDLYRSESSYMRYQAALVAAKGKLPEGKIPGKVLLAQP